MSRNSETVRKYRKSRRRRPRSAPAMPRPLPLPRSAPYRFHAPAEWKTLVRRTRRSRNVSQTRQRRRVSIELCGSPDAETSLEIKTVDVRAFKYS